MCASRSRLCYETWYKVFKWFVSLKETNDIFTVLISSVRTSMSLSSMLVFSVNAILIIFITFELNRVWYEACGTFRQLLLLNMSYPGFHETHWAYILKINLKNKMSSLYLHDLWVKYFPQNKTFFKNYCFYLGKFKSSILMENVKLSDLKCHYPFYVILKFLPTVDVISIFWRQITVF